MRAGLIFLSASLVSVLVWLLPAHAGGQVKPVSPIASSTARASDIGASRTKGPASLSQVEELVAASVKVQRLDARTAAELTKITYDTADAIESIPVDCTSASAGCVFGDAGGDSAVVLFGDSHVRMWLPAIIPIATADHLKLIVIGRDGCPVVSPSISDRFGGCASVVTSAIKTIDRIKPAAIIMSERTTYAGVSSAAWRAALTKTIDDLRPSGAKVAIIGDIQALNSGDNSDLVTCLVNHPLAVQSCAVRNPNGAAPGQQKAEEEAASLARDVYINPIPWLCTRRVCSPIIGNNIAYWNAFHISVSYARHLSGVMGHALSPFLTGAT